MTYMAGISDENIRRVGAQQEKTIHLIIGNPPYNANQRNENENNKNREYPDIDKYIKDTFIEESTAQKTKLYDMYTRFYRWAMYRLNSEGMVAFVTNRSFIDARSFDGFRRVVLRDFAVAYIVDLGGDIRAKGQAAGSNVFGIMTGVAVMFLIKKKKAANAPCKLHYFAYPTTDDKHTKLSKLARDKVDDLAWQTVVPDADANWINQSTSNFASLPVPVCDKATKLGHKEQALFKLYSLGVATNRDNWVYDRSTRRLKQKMQHSIKHIRQLAREDRSYPTTIKWSRDLKKKFHAAKEVSDFNSKKIIRSTYRPFCTLNYYAEKYWSDVLTENHTEALRRKP